MQTRNRFFDDIAKVANSAVGTMAGMKDEVEQMVRHRVESFIGGMNLVSREEFDVVKAMAAKAREENALLEKRIAELEQPKSARKPKSAPRKTAAKKPRAAAKPKKA